MSPTTFAVGAVLTATLAIIAGDNPLYTCLFVLPVMLLPLLFLFGISCMIHIVQPSRRKPVVHMDGKLAVLKPGLHLTFPPVAPWFSISTGPWRAWANGSSWPGVGTRVNLDPPATQVHTTEGISATVDVSVECTISDWSASVEELVADASSIPQRAACLVNQWLSEQLCNVSVDNFSYAIVLRQLNSPDAISALNATLANSKCHVIALRVLIDPNGVKLAPENAKCRMVALTKAQEQTTEQATLLKEGELDRLRHENEAKRAVFVQDQARITAEREVEMARLSRAAAAEMSEAEASRAQSLLSAGLQPEHVAAILVAQVANKALEGARSSDRIIVAPSSAFGLCGLPALAQHWADASTPDGSTPPCTTAHSRSSSPPVLIPRAK